MSQVTSAEPAAPLVPKRLFSAGEAGGNLFNHVVDGSSITVIQTRQSGKAKEKHEPSRFHLSTLLRL